MTSIEEFVSKSNEEAKKHAIKVAADSMFGQRSSTVATTTMPAMVSDKANIVYADTDSVMVQMSLPVKNENKVTTTLNPIVARKAYNKFVKPYMDQPTPREVPDALLALIRDEHRQSEPMIVSPKRVITVQQFRDIMSSIDTKSD